MQKVTNYPDFFDRLRSHKLKNPPRLICPDCQGEHHKQDDSDYTLDCKNLYEYREPDSIGCDHGQCLCYSREHGIRKDAIARELEHGQAQKDSKLRDYLIELLKYQLQRKYQPDWYQAEVKKILEQHNIQNAMS